MRVINIILTFIMTLFCLSSEVLAESCKEYGIVIIPPKEFSEEARRLNTEIASRIVSENKENIYHISLYQLCMYEEKLSELYTTLLNHKFKKLEIEMLPDLHADANNRNIYWNAKKNDKLLNLHRKTIELASAYRDGTILRSKEDYKKFPKNFQRQIDTYGIHGILESYTPHITLYYNDKEAKNMPQILNDLTKPTKYNHFKASVIAIGELGYQGNLLNTLYTIEMK